jgi:hypothetical protein
MVCCCLLLPRSQLEGVEVRSVGNSQVLKETALVEAFNLKAAVEIVMKNNTAAAEALAHMPPRWGVLVTRRAAAARTYTYAMAAQQAEVQWTSQLQASGTRLLVEQLNCT